MEFTIKKSKLGAGFEVTFEGQAMWFKQAMSPLDAAIAGIQYVSSHGGPKASDLIKAIPDASLQKSIVEYCLETMKKAEAPVEKPVTRAQALAYLESQLKKAWDPMEGKKYMEMGEFYTRISMMKSDEEFRQHPKYRFVAAEVRASEG
jgi:hypothetical protein